MIITSDFATVLEPILRNTYRREFHNFEDAISYIFEDDILVETDYPITGPEYLDMIRKRIV